MSHNGNGRMILELLRRALKSTPFKPFTITLTDGEAIEIGHPEKMIVHNEDLILGVDRKNIGFFIGAEHCVSIRSGIGHHRKARRTGA